MRSGFSTSAMRASWTEIEWYLLRVADDRLGADNIGGPGSAAAR